MKYFYLIVLACISSIGYSQINPVDFEAGGNGADWTWTVFENDTNPPLEIVSNPDPSGINTSNTVAKFTALVTGMPFAGCETMHGSDIGAFELTADNAFVSIMVYKTVTSDVGFKLVEPDGASNGEIKVANTLVNQWERLVFDFTALIGDPVTDNIDQIVVFPDFQARTGDNIIYFDNIEFSDSALGIESQDTNNISLYPNPAKGQVQLRGTQPIETVTVYDQLGRNVLNEQTNATSLDLDISKLPTGLYFISIQAEGRSIVKKLVVK